MSNGLAVFIRSTRADIPPLRNSVSVSASHLDMPDMDLTSNQPQRQGFEGRSRTGGALKFTEHVFHMGADRARTDA